MRQGRDHRHADPSVSMDATSRGQTKGEARSDDKVHSGGKHACPRLIEPRTTSPGVLALKAG